MNEEKTERKPAGISFTFGDYGVKQDLKAATGKDMLTAAAILLVQVANFEKDSDVEKVTDIFLKGYLPEAIFQMKETAKEEALKEGATERFSTVEELVEDAAQRMEDMDTDAQIVEGELKEEAKDERNTEN